MSILITTHLNADFDCLGSLIAALNLYPDAQAVFPGAQEKRVREYLEERPEIASRIHRLKDVDLSRVDHLVLVDVQQAERIGPLAAVAARPGLKLTVYDHHPTGEGSLPCGEGIIAPTGSTVTILTRLLAERDRLPSGIEATTMMLGIYEDTGSLLFNSCTPEDFRAAALLLANGADLSVVAATLAQELTAEQFDLLHQLLQNRSVLTVRGIAVTIAHASLSHPLEDISFVAHKMRDMEGISALIIAVRNRDRVIMVGRSQSPEVPMGRILSVFGGGGHDYAASATVKDLTLVQILEKLPAVLQQEIAPRWQARHLMTTPAKSLSAEATLRQARQLLARYNINAAPVLEQEAVVGILTRQTADRAALHDLLDEPVSEFMNRDFFTAAPETPVSELKDLIVSRNQRFVPIIEKNRLVGALTRTDLLRHLVSGDQTLPLTGPAYEGEPRFKRRQIERLIQLLPAGLPDKIRTISSVADSAGVSVYLVGGFVRDLLLHRPDFDLDLVVEGDGIGFAERLAAATGGRLRSHNKFNTAVVILPDHFKIDVASARMEYYLQPGALPTVENASLKLDLYRRDFTINTLAVSLNSESYGELYDFYGGQNDLLRGTIRVLHNLSFVEDPTRAYRAVRFEQRLNFRIGEQTESLLRSAVRMQLIARVGTARLGAELIAILKENDPYPGLCRLVEFDLLIPLHPALALTEKSAELFAAATRTLHWHQLLYTDEMIEPWQLYFLCLTANLSQQENAGLVNSLHLSERLTRIFVDGRNSAEELEKALYRSIRKGVEMQPSDIVRLFSPLPTILLLYLNARIEAEPIRRLLSRYLVHLRTIRPETDGETLKKLGYPPGPLFREILDMLQAARLDGRVNSYDEEIALIRSSYPQ